MRRHCCRLMAGEPPRWPASRDHPCTQSLDSADRKRRLQRCSTRLQCWSKSRTAVAAGTPGVEDAVVEENVAAEASA